MRVDAVDVLAGRVRVSGAVWTPTTPSGHRAWFWLAVLDRRTGATAGTSMRFGTDSWPRA